jgi:hypothetical protein
MCSSHYVSEKCDEAAFPYLIWPYNTPDLEEFYKIPYKVFIYEAKISYIYMCFIT